MEVCTTPGSIIHRNTCRHRTRAEGNGAATREHEVQVTPSQASTRRDRTLENLMYSPIYPGGRKDPGDGGGEVALRTAMQDGGKVGGVINGPVLAPVEAA